MRKPTEELNYVAYSKTYHCEWVVSRFGAHLELFLDLGFWVIMMNIYHGIPTDIKLNEMLLKVL